MNSTSALGSRRRNASFVPFAAIFEPMAPVANMILAAGAAMARRFGNRIHMIHRGIVFRRTVSTLSNLDDRTLRDIGITRSDIIRVAQEVCEL